MAHCRTGISDRELDVDSSPDPLSISLSRNNKSIVSKSSRKASSGPFAPTSGNSQRLEASPKKAFTTAQSPKKTITLHTPKSGGQSPWKIKVTVEAEPGENDVYQEHVRDVSPTPKPRSRTTTMTVPLKDPGSSPPVKRRGRPRKSISSESPKKKRASTPARRKSVTKIDVQDHGVAIEEALENAGQQEPKRKRGRPRKSSMHTRLFDDITQGPIHKSLAKSDVGQVEMPRPEATSDDVYDCINVETPQKSEAVSVKDFAVMNSNVPLGEKARKTSTQTTNAVTTAKDTASLDGHANEESLSEKTVLRNDIDNDDSVDILQSPKHNEEEASIAEEDSVIESEGFSIVSIDSLPSMQITMSSPCAMHEKTPLNVNAATDVGSRIGVPNSTKAPSYSADYQISTAQLCSVSKSIEDEQTQGAAGLVIHGTPSMSHKSPSNPPALIPSPVIPRNASTPKLARVVKAGIALQGVLDTNTRRTPGKTPVQVANDSRTRLDEIFSGFGEGTRRELKAGLRFGEEMARLSEERGVPEESRSKSNLGLSSGKVAATGGDDIFATKSSTKESTYPRLPTPEENDQYSLALPPPPTEHSSVQYPSLITQLGQVHIKSPAQSEDDMNWQPNTPPSTRSNSGSEALPESHAELPEGKPIYYPSIGLTQTSGADLGDMSDIWEEEASRDAEFAQKTNDQPKKINQPTERTEDLLVEDASFLRPRRGKLPKTWRRVSASDFNYSDEMEGESPASHAKEYDPATESLSHQAPKDGSIHSERSEGIENDDQDDTGFFWQSSLPAVFQRREQKKQRDKKIDLSELLGLNRSPLKSSPLSSPNKLRPFKEAAPFTSPIKLQPASRSSPLKQQLTSGMSPKSEDASEVLQEESTKDVSLSSDRREILQETQARIEIASPGPAGEHSKFADHIEDHRQDDRTPIRSPNATGMSLTPTREYTPLFFGRPTHKSAIREEAPVSPSAASYSGVGSKKPPSSSSATNPSFFTRLTRTLFSVSPSTPTTSNQPNLHPIARSIGPLPRTEPWTKTHYVALDSIYQQYKRSPPLFSPTAPHNTRALAAAIPDAAERARYIGARFTVWGYGITITEDLLVMAAAFAGALTAQDIADWERETGRAIERGSVCPRHPDGVDARGRTVQIDFEEVVRRLVTVVLGEAVRRDEARGRGDRVKRERGMRVVWAGERRRRRVRKAAGGGDDVD